MILVIFCIGLLFFSYATGFAGGPLQVVADYIFVPMQNGLGKASSRIYETLQEGQTKKELVAENEELKARLSELETRLGSIQLEANELASLRELYDLDKSLPDYKTTGAHVIARGSNNWFSTFTIDKGSADGIVRDMNVIAGSGLVGIVTEVGKNYAVVRSIIDDTANVSAMVSSTGDNCIVSGNLKRMADSNMIDITGLEDKKDRVKAGEALVTSNISDKYLKGIQIGYISKLHTDSNDMTKSGTVTPVVDFKHLTEVLVIMKLKKTGNMSGGMGE